MIYAQPNSWQCGPFALKHALLMYGRAVHENELAQLAGSNESVGTDEHGLARALEAVGGALEVIRRRTRQGARDELGQWLSRGVPVLLCVDQWDHWITAAADLGDRVAVFDSHFDNAVFRAEPWDRLLDRMVFRQRWLRGVWTTSLWDLHPVLLRSAGVRPFRRDRVIALLTHPRPDLAVAEELGLPTVTAAAHAPRDEAAPSGAPIVGARSPVIRRARAHVA